MLLVKNSRLSIVIALGLVLAVAACKKGWKDHNDSTDPNLGINLITAIKADPEASQFVTLLTKTGYDKVLASSKSFTVWVPNNNAIAALPASVLADTNLLKSFVGNHITNGSITSGVSGVQRIPMLNGKYTNLNNLQLDSASIVKSNKYCSNGLYNLMDKFVPVKDNCWQWLLNSTGFTSSKNFFLSLNYSYFDSASATQTGVDPNTGQPVYKPGTGLSTRNRFLDNVMNVSDESKEYTFIILNDAAFAAENTKLTPWFKTTSVDTTNNLAGSWLVKDLAVQGSFAAAQLPDTLISQYGVKVPIDKTKILSSVKTSNGWVHTMSQVNFTLAHKFPPIIIQGENPSGFASDRTAQLLFRNRKNPVTGENFKDILMQNYSFASYWVRYLSRNMNSMRYNAFWVAVNDVQTTPLWTQRLGVDSVTTAGNFPYITVANQNYNEVSLGQFTVPRYKDLNLFLIGANSSSSSGGGVSVSLDYIKLVPAF
jgi:uncharacterized surface protein with fasciclin (FAS1) repeats